MDTDTLIKIVRLSFSSIVGPYEVLDVLHAEERLVIPHAVKVELEHEGIDRIISWIRTNPTVVAERSEDVIEQVGYLASRFEGYWDIAKYPDEADPWVIAEAMRRHGPLNGQMFGDTCTVVTQESTKKPRRIPAVCGELSLPCTDFDGLCEGEGWEIGLRPRD